MLKPGILDIIESELKLALRDEKAGVMREPAIGQNIHNNEIHIYRVNHDVKMDREFYASMLLATVYLCMGRDCLEIALYSGEPLEPDDDDDYDYWEYGRFCVTDDAEPNEVGVFLVEFADPTADVAKAIKTVLAHVERLI